jgi:diaminopimelate epimerase
MTKSELSFVKMTGAGNDFVLVDNRSEGMSLDWGALAPSVCDRRYGVGADGLIVLRAPAGDGDFTMEYYNADGSYGGMCGNGGRCAASFVMEDSHRDEVAFQAVGHLYKAQRLPHAEIRLQMKDIVSLGLHRELTLMGQNVIGHAVDSGTAHVVLWYDELPETWKQGFDAMDIDPIGKGLRNHPAFAPGGTNVNIIRQIDGSTIALRTFERGVEGETLACGTGSVASAVVAHAIKNFPQEIRVITRSNEVLRVSFTPAQGIYTNVTLSGPARNVFSGRVNLADLKKS